MNLHLFNTLGGKIEKFEPLTPGKVTLYVCGVTPYDTSHLGHAFVFVVFDSLIRFLRFQGLSITYTQNVTDIDDPLIERAEKLGVTWQELAKKWTDYLLRDFKFLNIEMPTNFVYATSEVPMMQEIVAGLIKNGFGYIAGGNVYFDLKKFSDYGKLSKLPREEMLKIAQERGGDIADPNKKEPLDFILWKKSKPDEPQWDSPWGLPAGRQGAGRPGWHIECTAMSMKFLGEQIDIHGGGTDLIYPHHESEIAQAEGFSGKHPFVREWMHVAMVAYEKTKMSKSLGNLVYVQDLAKKHSANAIRFLLLSHHYRNEWEFKNAEMAKISLKVEEFEKKIKNVTEGNIPVEFINALENDFDVPKAMEIMMAAEVGSAKAMYRLLGFGI